MRGLFTGKSEQQIEAQKFRDTVRKDIKRSDSVANFLIVQSQELVMDMIDELDAMKTNYKITHAQYQKLCEDRQALKDKVNDYCAPPPVPPQEEAASIANNNNNQRPAHAYPAVGQPAKRSPTTKVPSKFPKGFKKASSAKGGPIKLAPPKVASQTAPAATFRSSAAVPLAPEAPPAPAFIPSPTEQPSTAPQGSGPSRGALLDEILGASIASLKKTDSSTSLRSQAEDGFKGLQSILAGALDARRGAIAREPSGGEEGGSSWSSDDDDQGHLPIQSRVPQ